MKRALIAVSLGVFFALGTSPAALAFECPSNFNAAKAAIEKATSAMSGMAKGANRQMVHTLIDDAKTMLESGIHNHEKPQGAYDHARAIAKARAAKGYAEAAAIMAENVK